MIYLLQKRYDVKVAIRVGGILYLAIMIAITLLVGMYFGSGSGEYTSFYIEWDMACAGMIVMLLCFLEVGITLVFMVGKAKTVRNSLPFMAPQCGVFLIVIIINIGVLGNPNRFQQLWRDLPRAEANNPEVEEVPGRAIVCESEQVRRRRRTRYEYYFTFNGKRAEVSESMYDSILKTIDGTERYANKAFAAEGRYRVRYLPNSLIILDVSKVETVKRGYTG